MTVPPLGNDLQAWMRQLVAIERQKAGEPVVELWGYGHKLGPDEVMRPYGCIALYGHGIRQAALAVLILARGWPPLSIGIILDRMAERQCVICADRPERVLSDALGHEVRKGRAVRVSRGWYRAGQLSRTTERRYLHRWGLRCWPSAVEGLPPARPRGRRP